MIAVVACLLATLQVLASSVIKPIPALDFSVTAMSTRELPTETLAGVGVPFNHVQYWSLNADYSGILWIGVWGNFSTGFSLIRFNEATQSVIVSPILYMADVHGFYAYEVTAGNQYLIPVYGAADGQFGEFSLKVVKPSQPRNLYVDKAEDIELPFAGQANNQNTSVVGLSGLDVYLPRALFWKYQAPSSGVIWVSANANFSFSFTVIQYLEASKTYIRLPNLVASQDGFFSVSVQKASTYFISVYSLVPTQFGDFSLRVLRAMEPSNMDISSPMEITSLPFYASLNNQNATVTQLRGIDVYLTRALYWTMNSSFSGIIWISLKANFSSEFRIFRHVDSVNAFFTDVPLYGTEKQFFAYDVQQGSKYFIAVYSRDFISFGDLTLTMLRPLQPKNSVIENATPITKLPYFIDGLNNQNTSVAELSGLGVIFNRAMYWSYDSTFNGSLWVSVAANFTFDFRVIQYHEPSKIYFNAPEIRSSYRSNLRAFKVFERTKYWIIVYAQDRISNAFGSFSLSVVDTVPLDATPVPSLAPALSPSSPSASSLSDTISQAPSTTSRGVNSQSDGSSEGNPSGGVSNPRKSSGSKTGLIWGSVGAGIVVLAVGGFLYGRKRSDEAHPFRQPLRFAGSEMQEYHKASL